MAKKEEKKAGGSTEEVITEAASVISPLEAAERSAAEFKDMALRARADYENLKKNNINIIRDTKDRVVSELLEEFLPVLDSFNRAEEAISDAKTLEGLAIIKEQINAVLKRYDVTPIQAADKPFDPNFHNCIMQVDNPDKCGVVVYEIQKGYMLKDRVLRHSLVAVGGEKAEEAE